MGLSDGFERWVWAMGLGGGDFGGLGAEPGFYLDKLQIICKTRKSTVFVIFSSILVSLIKFLTA